MWLLSRACLAWWTWIKVIQNSLPLVQNWGRAHCSWTTSLLINSMYVSCGLKLKPRYYCLIKPATFIFTAIYANLFLWNIPCIRQEWQGSCAKSYWSRLGMGMSRVSSGVPTYHLHRNFWLFMAGWIMQDLSTHLWNTFFKQVSECYKSSLTDWFHQINKPADYEMRCENRFIKYLFPINYKNLCLIIMSSLTHRLMNPWRASSKRYSTYWTLVWYPSKHTTLCNHIIQSINDLFCPR